MIRLYNLRTEKKEEWTRLVCDVDVTEGENPFKENTMWFAVKNENAHMFSVKIYDAFFLVPLYLGMFHGQDLKIEGKVSKKLYRNMMNYGQKILCNFSDDLKPIQVFVDGFDNVETGAELIGTGISCGVDSLSTIYDRYVKENDSEYRVNSLFIFNCGTHGAYENPETRERFLGRYELNKGAADALELPVYQVDSNLHAFSQQRDVQKWGYLALHSCILSLQKVIKKYYMSSTYSYDEIMRFGKCSHDFDMAEYTDSYLLPLIQTERLELVLDGCQYKRSGKTENISNWDIAKRHLNVCVNPAGHVQNCSCCSKCLRTLIVLESMGKLQDFSGVFDIAVYKKHAFVNKCRNVLLYSKEGFATDNVDYALQHGIKMPSVMYARIYLIIHGLVSKSLYNVKVLLHKIIGNNKYELIKRRIKG